MYSFIVLGQIPGTNLSISFEAWILITILAAYFVFRKRKKISRFFDELENPHKYRKPLHANRLHQRAL